MGHAGVEAIAAFLAESGLWRASIEEQRRWMTNAGSSTPPPEGVRVEEGALGGRPAEWLRPVDGLRGGVVLYLHGGGYCIGSLGTHRGVAGRIALATGATVVTLDYRLAPEDPFPAAIADATAAYEELRGLGHAPEATAIAGDSAGGGLTVATLLALRGAGAPLPAAAACLSPWVDLTQSAPSYATLAAGDPLVSREGLDTMAAAYLGGASARDPLASPLFADDLGGLPPIRIDVGEREILLDDSVRLAERIVASGGEATLARWAEMIHVFQIFAGALDPEASESVAAIGEFLAGHLRV
jgi:epsilon-lactone hydrolase